MDWNPGTVCVYGAGSLRPAALCSQRRVARASSWWHYSYAPVQFQLRAISVVRYNPGVQRWRVVCFNSAMRTRYCTTRAATMLGGAADYCER